MTVVVLVRDVAETPLFVRQWCPEAPPGGGRGRSVFVFVVVIARAPGRLARVASVVVVSAPAGSALGIGAAAGGIAIARRVDPLDRSRRVERRRRVLSRWIGATRMNE
jgi:hypothetical protein